MELSEFFSAHPKAALGFSGGVDSAYLLYAAVKAGANVQPYFIKTAFQPQFELDDALRLAAQLGVEVAVLPLDILSEPAVTENPADRCYHCKARLFGALSAEGINIRMIDQGSSEINIIVGIDNDDYEKCVRTIYREFFGEGNKTAESVL